MNEQKAKKIVVDDMLLTTDAPTSAGSKILEGYQSPIAADAILRATAAGYVVYDKAPVGEFAIDLLGETASRGAKPRDGILQNAAAEAVLSKTATAALCLDVNGYPRRAAAQTGLICLKPTYGSISRQGVVSVAPSGETVDILAREVEDCRELFNAVTEQSTIKAPQIRRVAILTSFDDGINDEIKQKINAAVSNLENSGISTTYIENNTILAAKTAWNVILCAELCKNAARYDGIRYGYRTATFSSLDELYTRSRTEGFGDLVKAAILWGAEVRSVQNYQKVYDKSLRVRRVIVNEFSKIFEDFDAVLLPACSSMTYTAEQVETDKYIAFDENRYTAPASITGLPSVISGGVQLIGKADAEEALLDVAKILAGEGK